MKPEDKLPSLGKLDEDIGRFRRANAPKAPESPQGTGVAAQMGAELVAGVLLGAGAGVALDRWLGTAPWLLIVCFLLGTAGGALNLYRTATREDAKDTKDKGND